MIGEETILWRRLDRPGHEAARIARKGEAWSLAGTAVFIHEGEPCRLERYESGGGRFTAELKVNAAGFVTLYPGFWRSEAAGQKR